MKPYTHAAVWLDHEQAHVFLIDPEHVIESILQPADPHLHLHLHHKANTIGSGKLPEDQHYFHAIVESLCDATEILIAGPAQAKLRLLQHLHRHDPQIAECVVGIETVDHPSDRQFAAYARHYLEVSDRCLV